jgi:pseudaminic acid cytidylyltransferase
VNLAVIPARGGSKRIPRKNILAFGGRPMIAWSIETAWNSGLFDRVIVSTDCDEVADVARKSGADVPFKRPAELSDDHCGTLEVITHAAQWAVGAGAAPKSICCIYATAPFVQADDLQCGLAEMTQRGWDYVFAAARFQQPVYRSFSRSEDGSMEMVFPEHRLTRSQDLPAVYFDAGQFYWGATDTWRRGAPIFGSRTSFVELPADRVQDIDTPDDWAEAERLFERLKGRGSC